MITRSLKFFRRTLSNCRARIPIVPSLKPGECNAMIKKSLQDQVPYFVTRLGWMEGYAIGKLLAEGETSLELREKLALHAGIFPPTVEQLNIVTATYLEALGNADVLGLIDAPYHGWVIKKYAKQAERAPLGALEPYFYEEPWSWELRGKTVLIVHPFVESITKQYSTVREKIFANPKMLPEFHLKVLKPPQTLPGNITEFNSWSETLKELELRVQQETFDVAIIGCGAYGLPLAATVKKMGKVAIHLGGATQLLFGVSGERWRRMPHFQTIITSVWQPPLENERPIGWEKIEDGCYW